MLAYKTFVIIENPAQVTLSNLPFRPGQRVEVVLIAEEDNAARVSELQTLFKATQALPQVQSLTEDDIAAEIAAYRTRQ